MPPTEFRAEFREMLGIAILLSLGGILSVCAGATIGSYWLIVLGICSLALLIALRIRCRVTLDDNAIRFRSLFTERIIPWGEIVRFERAADRSYLASRIYGPYTFEIEGQKQILRINFKFFSFDCLRIVFEKAGGISKGGSGQKTAK